VSTGGRAVSAYRLGAPPLQSGSVVSFRSLVAALHAVQLRFVVIGVWGANFHASSAAAVFATPEYDLFLPPEPDTWLEAWRVCAALGLSLRADDDSLTTPPDRVQAEAVVTAGTQVRASVLSGPSALMVDLMPVMTAFEFEPVWDERRVFVMDGVEVPVARLSHIIRSKAATNRDQDRLFLSTHAATLRQMLDGDED